MGGGAGRDRRRGKATDRGDPPSDRAFIVDLLASEYGWTRKQIDELPIDEEAELFHAILYRKGAKTYRREIQTEQHEPLSFAAHEIDTTDLEEVWHLP